MGIFKWRVWILWDFPHGDCKWTYHSLLRHRDSLPCMQGCCTMPDKDYPRWHGGPWLVHSRLLWEKTSYDSDSQIKYQMTDFSIPYYFLKAFYQDKYSNSSNYNLLGKETSKWTIYHVTLYPKLHLLRIKFESLPYSRHVRVISGHYSFHLTLGWWLMTK